MVERTRKRIQKRRAEEEEGMMTCATHLLAYWEDGPGQDHCPAVRDCTYDHSTDPEEKEGKGTAGTKLICR